jgi:hypothetical protein
MVSLHLIRYGVGVDSALTEFSPDAGELLAPFPQPTARAVQMRSEPVSILFIRSSVHPVHPLTFGRTHRGSRQDSVRCVRARHSP